MKEQLSQIKKIAEEIDRSANGNKKLNKIKLDKKKNLIKRLKDLSKKKKV
jgi:hypothetical protein